MRRPMLPLILVGVGAFTAGAFVGGRLAVRLYDRVLRKQVEEMEDEWLMFPLTHRPGL